MCLGVEMACRLWMIFGGLIFTFLASESLSGTKAGCQNVIVIKQLCIKNICLCLVALMTRLRSSMTCMITLFALMDGPDCVCMIIHQLHAPFIRLSVTINISMCWEVRLLLFCNTKDNKELIRKDRMICIGWTWVYLNRKMERRISQLQTSIQRIIKTTKP